MSRNGLQAILRQHAAFVEADSPHYALLPDPEALHTCHAVIAPIVAPYAPAEFDTPEAERPMFLFEVSLPKDFPDSPPKLRALTPNGVYQPGGWICLEFGAYHPGDWNPAFGIVGCVRELFNGFLVRPEGGGIGIVSPPTSDTAKHMLACTSRAWNLDNYPQLVAAFDELRASRPELTISRAPGRDDAVPLQYYLRWATTVAKGRDPDAELVRMAFGALCGPYWEVGTFMRAAVRAWRASNHVEEMPRAILNALVGYAALVGAVLEDAVWEIEPPANAEEALTGLYDALVRANVDGTRAEAEATVARLCANVDVCPVAMFNSLSESMGLGFDYFTTSRDIPHTTDANGVTVE